MPNVVQILILISTLIIWVPGLAQSSDASSPALLILRDNQTGYKLGQQMEASQPDELVLHQP
jgi:hypothetical protein